jgi:hypothetical protein
MQRALLWLALGTAGCAVTAQPLASLPLTLSCRVPSLLRTEKRFVILPFADQRGIEYSRTSVLNHIPGLNLIYSSRRVSYPEEAGMLVLESNHRRTVTTGSLATAMPQLMETAMRRMELAATVVSSSPFEVHGYDYVIDGALRRTQFRDRKSAVAAIVGGLFGAPHELVSYALEYEVRLFDARDLAHPIFQRTYQFDDSRVAGLYYNQGWAYPMFQAGLEATLPRAVLDVGAAVAEASRRAERPRPSVM